MRPEWQVAQGDGPGRAWENVLMAGNAVEGHKSRGSSNAYPARGEAGDPTGPDTPMWRGNMRLGAFWCLEASGECAGPLWWQTRDPEPHVTIAATVSSR